MFPELADIKFRDNPFSLLQLFPTPIHTATLRRAYLQLTAANAPRAQQKCSALQQQRTAGTARIREQPHLHPSLSSAILTYFPSAAVHKTRAAPFDTSPTAAPFTTRRFLLTLQSMTLRRETTECPTNTISAWHQSSPPYNLCSGSRKQELWCGIFRKIRLQHFQMRYLQNLWH